MFRRIISTYNLFPPLFDFVFVTGDSKTRGRGQSPSFFLNSILSKKDRPRPCVLLNSFVTVLSLIVLLLGDITVEFFFFYSYRGQYMLQLRCYE